ncbi:isoprenyl transferase [Tissierella creatinophila]|uniref:Isoprenyl transferase n=1 Tax=Tissierella creatinophila DSM 6911 TaxID=1123403 RepID=A0A1U7M359_TISCR|nr:isoprenyl transferase [Tissierella creatinophila]OLS01754.1 ditrans,polycis-undecaprenyl-diphosphate synthase ((2E,6E)-farnesyl-diphosphate specific) [Tissierella creatinophila DSM 6911]
MKDKSYDTDLLKLIDFKKLPKHIAIIMDGNGRWAKRKFLPRYFGHQEGMKRVIDIVSASSKLGIDCLTLYAFSTENWKRPEEEIESLMKILVSYIRKELEKLVENNVKLNIIGDISNFPTLARTEVERAIFETENNTGMNLNIALNYGGRDEIIYGIKNLLNDYKLGKINIDNLNSEIFSNYLYTKGQPDPDLLIRPSGELRISNFMLYQIAYTEFWFSDVLWPDFSEDKLYEAIIDFQKRNRRFGGL